MGERFTHCSATRSTDRNDREHERAADRRHALDDEDPERNRSILEREVQPIADAIDHGVSTCVPERQSDRECGRADHRDQRRVECRQLAGARAHRLHDADLADLSRADRIVAIRIAHKPSSSALNTSSASCAVSI